MTSNGLLAGKPETDLKPSAVESADASGRVDTTPGFDTQIERAEARTDRAEARTEKAEARTEMAEARTERAEARTELVMNLSQKAIRASELSYRRLFEAAKEGI